jgi:hypothetical protein
MWTCELPDEPLTLTLNFLAPVHLSALVIWNYNGSIENLDCGVCTYMLFHFMKKIIFYYAGEIYKT